MVGIFGGSWRHRGERPASKPGWIELRGGTFRNDRLNVDYKLVMQTEKVHVERSARVATGGKSSQSQFTSTSVSIPSLLLVRAREKANMSYRTFSQYISFLISQDLRRSRERHSPMADECTCSNTVKEAESSQM
jgi:hypothetical protein